MNANGAIPGQDRAAAKLLEHDGDVTKLVDAQRIAGGQLDAEVLKAYAIPVLYAGLVEVLREELPWPLNRNVGAIAERLVGRAWGVAAGLTATAIEAERAWLEDQGA